MFYFSNNRSKDERMFLYISYIKETADIDKKYSRVIANMTENTKRGFTNYKYFINKINLIHAKSQISWRKIEMLPFNIIWLPADKCNHMRMERLLDYTEILNEFLDTNDEKAFEEVINKQDTFKKYLYTDGFYEVGICQTLMSAAIAIEDVFSLKN
jgi:hypothetical protein